MGAALALLLVLLLLAVVAVVAVVVKGGVAWVWPAHGCKATL